MDRSDIRDAIVLFEFSQAARSNRRGPEVVRHLWDLFRRDEIGFRDMPNPNTRGSFLAGRAGHDLRVNTDYIDQFEMPEQLGALSLVLAHEGTHALNPFDYLYEELAARLLQLSYFRELSGPGVFNEANDPPRPGRPWTTIYVTASRFPYYQRQLEALRRDQLIDHILAADSYQGERYVDAQWVIDNRENWGTLTNRRPETLGLYIRRLAPTVDHHFTATIVDIMECVNRRADWDDMMDAAGRLRTIRIALDDLSARPEFAPRIVALERRWDVHLREEPPRR